MLAMCKANSAVFRIMIAGNAVASVSSSLLALKGRGFATTLYGFGSIVYSTISQPQGL